MKKLISTIVFCSFLCAFQNMHNCVNFITSLILSLENLKKLWLILLLPPYRYLEIIFESYRLCVYTLSLKHTYKYTQWIAYISCTSVQVYDKMYSKQCQGQKGIFNLYQNSFEKKQNFIIFIIVYFITTCIP